MIKAIIFDLDGTLLDRDSSLQHFIANQYERFLFCLEHIDRTEIFHRALRRLGVKAEESVYIGDNPEADIIGAKNAGLKTIWKRNQFWDEPKEAGAVIDGLDEILPRLRQLY